MTEHHTIDGQDVDPTQIGEGKLSEEQLLYKENILEHFRNPRKKYSMQHATTKMRGNNPFCGDVIEIFLFVENGIVADISFQGHGCAISQASMSMLTDKIRGMKTEDVLRMDQEDVLNMLGIPIGIVRRKCAMLGLRTTQNAIGEFHGKA